MNFHGDLTEEEKAEELTEPKSGDKPARSGRKDKVYRVDRPDELQQAGPSDLIQLWPVPGANPLFLPKSKLEVAAYAIANHEFMHLSGPTGGAKSSLLEALALPENFVPICEALGFPFVKPVKLFPVEMAVFESPAELYQRRALKDGCTFDEPSILVQALEQASVVKKKYTPLVWLREMGRVHSASVQGALLNLMTPTDIILPSGTRISGDSIAWVADSNYQADSDSTHTLVTLDDALKRRFSINLTLPYLSFEQDEQVLFYLIEQAGLPVKLRELVPRTVKLGHAIRSQRIEGNLQSVTPPTIYGYMAVIRMVHALPHLHLQEIVINTLLGNASLEDSKIGLSVFNEVFGIQAEIEEDSAVGGAWF